MSQRVDHQVEEALNAVFGELATLAAEYSVELFWLGVVGLFYGLLYLASAHSFAVAGVSTFLLVSVVLGIGRSLGDRPHLRLIRRSLDTSRVRRSWYRAVKHCGFAHRIPVYKVVRINAGYRARIKVGRGISFKDVEMRKEPLAASMAIKDVRVQRDPHNASTGTITFIRNDLLKDIGGTAWPGATAPQTQSRGPRPRFHRPSDDPPREHYARPKKPPKSPKGGGSNGGESLWDPIPIGQDEEHGDPVTITLPERSCLIGGTPGSGKSAAMSMMLARAALDRDVRLYLIDGKEVELQYWEKCAEEVAYTIEEAIALLQILQRRLTERLKELRRHDIRTVASRPGELPLYAFFIDELAFFTANPDKKLAAEFTSSLTSILTRGRAAGIIPVAATQKPEGAVVPTSLRDLFVYRLALRCSTPEASDTILGRGWAGQGFDAKTIPPGNPGVGFLLAEDGIPQRIRTHYLNDEAIRTYAEQALQGRQA